MNMWVFIVVAGLLTLAIRFSFIFLLERVNVPGWFQNGLRFVPVTVLSAIILPELVQRNGGVDVSLLNPQVLSGALAILVAWRTKNVVLTILAGMVALLVFQSLLGHA